MSETENQNGQAEQAGSTGSAAEDKISGEELRQRLEEELRKIQVRDVLVQTAITLVNLGFLRLGLTQSTEGDRDLAQASDAIDALRALLPVAEKENPEEFKGLREALSQMQMQYANLVKGDGGEEGEKPSQERPASEAAPKKESSSKLWTPPGV